MVIVYPLLPRLFSSLAIKLCRRDLMLRRFSPSLSKGTISRSMPKTNGSAFVTNTFDGVVLYLFDF